jgi:maltose alpha-D-glucosyltransferase / alpha-amylase
MAHFTDAGLIMTTALARSIALAEAQDPLWYKDAIIYQLHIKSFYDANDDGVGDFPGLLSRLDYIVSLGVTAIWLLPFYPSPRLDDGYDISDFRGVHPDYGKLVDVKRFIAAAHAHGLRVITEFVINHTSDQHPWFQRARAAKRGSAYRDYYVWSDDDRKYASTRIIFLDTERSNWTLDPVAAQYYWHRFYSHQPDLNYDNPRVLKEMLGVLRFWLEMGVDGLRLDAVPYLVEREGTSNENLAETHAILRQIRANVDASFPNRMLLAEANQWPEDAKEYFGNGDECHMAFHFPLMPRMYMAIAREDRFPISDILRQTPDIPGPCQWAIFLRNHDELTLEMVTNAERAYLWETYAADRLARLNLGIRRRLAPLLENDRRRIELMNYLLLSMPGTPVIYYGDEIGMGDNIHLGDRNGVRTPMQWSPDRNGGFSRADPSRLVLPANMDPLWGYESRNVESQNRDRHSLLNWMRRTLAIRRQHQAFGRGSFRLLYPKNRKILAYLREYEETTLLCVANLSRAPQAVELDLSEFDGRVPIELDGGSIFPPVGQLTYMLTLPPYGFYWFQLAKSADWPSLHSPAPEPMPDYLTIVTRAGLADGLQRARAMFEHDVLPTYLAKRRWFSAKDQTIDSARVALMVPLPNVEREVLLTEIETSSNGGVTRWQLPLSVWWEADPTVALPSQLALARVRRVNEVGLLTDAFAVAAFAHAMMKGLAGETRLTADGGEIRFRPEPGLRDVSVDPNVDINWPLAEQTNSSLIINDETILKVYRRLVGGPHPEAEMTRYLTRGGFANSSGLLGEVLRIDADGTPYTLAIAQRFIRNQGDAWAWTLDWLTRALSDISNPTTAAVTDEAAQFADYDAIAGTLGRRLGEMHAILARPTDDPDFVPESAEGNAAAEWADRARSQVERASAAATTHAHTDATLAEAAGRLAASVDRLLPCLTKLAKSLIGTSLTRIHGDFHLGQALVANGDLYIIDFEGEPARPLTERRAKTSPYRDVAGIIRSFGYAAAVVRRKSSSSMAHLTEAQREEFLEAFLRHAEAAFLTSYREAIGPGEDNTDLLELALIEKAAYEVNYEAANRPAWIDVPLDGLLELTERLLARAA